MADQNSSSTAPILKKPLPPFVTYEKASFGPITLSDFVDTTDERHGKIKFSAVQVGAGSVPQGFICTTNGVFGGIPAPGTAGTYDIEFTAENDTKDVLVFSTTLTINLPLAMEENNFYGAAKAEVWQALGEGLPIPELHDALTRPITPVEIYYLLERYAILTIWDVYNLESPGKLVSLNLPGMNPHYHFYDRGSCLVVAPKKLFSHERTLRDALDASRVMAKEAYKRGWTIEFAGFNKMVSAAWVELQLQADKNNGKHIEILHYQPNSNEMELYKREAEASRLRPSM